MWSFCLYDDIYKTLVYIKIVSDDEVNDFPNVN